MGYGFAISVSICASAEGECGNPIWEDAQTERPPLQFESCRRSGERECPLQGGGCPEPAVSFRPAADAVLAPGNVPVGSVGDIQTDPLPVKRAAASLRATPPPDRVASVQALVRVRRTGTGLPTPHMAPPRLFWLVAAICLGTGSGIDRRDTRPPMTRRHGRGPVTVRGPGWGTLFSRVRAACAG
jgi:hypothetical protein